MESMFCCPVCGERLTREARLYRCAGGHCFDLAREGYVNLLPANQRHSAAPGDDREMVAARTRFLDGGWYAPLRQKLCALAGELAALRQEQAMLTEKLSGADRDTEMEALARERLGMVRPGDTVFYFISGSD